MDNMTWCIILKKKQLYNKKIKNKNYKQEFVTQSVVATFVENRSFYTPICISKTALGGAPRFNTPGTSNSSTSRD